VTTYIFKIEILFIDSLTGVQDLNKMNLGFLQQKNEAYGTLGKETWHKVIDRTRAYFSTVLNNE